VGLSDLLTDEAGCRTGKVVGGGPYLAHGQGSAYCQQVLANVKRDAAGNITAVYVGPINKAQLYVSGIDAKLTYALRTENWGAFNLELQYTDNLSYKERNNASDPLVNTRYDRVASKVRGTLAWHEGKWDATLYGDRAGSIRANNYGGCEILPNGIQPQAGDPDCVVYNGKIKPWIVWSTSVGYQFNDKVKLRLGVTNIFDNMGEIPYYAGGFEFIPTLQGANYNGREVLATVNYKLD
jgi:outer membrane receptor for ferrienterochelin and colicin